MRYEADINISAFSISSRADCKSNDGIKNLLTQVASYLCYVDEAKQKVKQFGKKALFPNPLL